MATKLEPMGTGAFFTVSAKFVNGEVLTLPKVTNLNWEVDVVTMITVDAWESGYTFILRNTLWIKIDRIIP